MLNGELVEGVEDPDKIFLANLDLDSAEGTNRINDRPDLVYELRETAEEWRRQLEERWDREFSIERQGTTGRAT